MKHHSRRYYLLTFLKAILSNLFNLILTLLSTSNRYLNHYSIYRQKIIKICRSGSRNTWMLHTIFDFGDNQSLGTEAYHIQ